jgi:protein transport protein SEC20
MLIYDRSRVEFRRAQLTAKRNLEAAKHQERYLLLASMANPSRPSTPSSILRRQTRTPTELSKEDKEVRAASDVTAALRRTHQLMQAELSRSQFAHDTLKESTAALGELGESYSVLDTLLAGSRNLLGTLLRSQKSDTWYLETAFYVLLATIVWLIFRRFIYGPAWWLIWLPLKMFYKAWMGVFVAVGLRENRDGVFAVSSSSAAIPSRPPLIVHSSGTRKPKPTNMKPPSGGRGVGAGGLGAKTGDHMRDDDYGKIMEKVGKIIDDSQESVVPESAVESEVEVEVEDVDGTEPGEKIEPNPKKRVWIEDEEVKKEEIRQRDEL